MKHAKYNYIHGSTAEKYYHSGNQEEDKLRKPVRYKKNKNAVKLAYICLLAIAFAACMVLMKRYVAITEMNYKYSTENNNYAGLKDANSKLKSDIEKDTDLQKIKIRAEEMGMQKPDKSQIVYILVPRGDSIEISEEYKDKNNSVENDGIKLKND